jgi:uncharacterized DUF497 family protein
VARIRFEWDEAKNFANQRKHGVSFEDAIEAFYDPLQVSVQEGDYGGETRWQTFGLVKSVLLLMVVNTTWEEGDDETSVEAVRIISARPATPKERRDYEIQNR